MGARDGGELSMDLESSRDEANRPEHARTLEAYTVNRFTH